MCVTPTSSILFNRPAEYSMLSGGLVFVRFFFTDAISFYLFFPFLFCMFMTAKDDEFWAIQGWRFATLGIDKRREDTQDFTMTIKILSKLNCAAFANDYYFLPPYFAMNEYASSTVNHACPNLQGLKGFVLRSSRPLTAND